MNRQKFTAVAVMFATFLAFSGVAAAQTSEYSLQTGTLTEEKVWGSSNNQVTGDRVLDVVVSQTESHVKFHAETSEIDGSSGETLAVDKDADGTADYQIQYNNGEWIVLHHDENGWFQDGSLPNDFDASLSSGEFTVSVPVKNLDEGGEDFKYGIQVNTEDGQLLYPDGDRLWFNGDNYVSSDHYRDAQIDYFEQDDSEQVREDLLEDINSLETALDDVETDTVENSDEISSLQNELDSARQAVNQQLSDKAEKDTVSEVELRVSTLETEVESIVGEEVIDNKVSEGVEEAKDYSDSNEKYSDSGDIVSTVRSFFEQQTNVIKDWVRTNFASKETVQAEQEEQDQLEKRVQELEVETQVQSETIDNLAEETGVEQGSTLESAQEIMLENNLDQISVTEDGKDWTCKRQVSKYGIEDAVCVHQVE